jgi:DNA-directed RNA polymerase subunit H (RpoH/RPB5)
MPPLNFTVLIPKVEDGRKEQSAREAKCIHEKKDGRCSDIGVGSKCLIFWGEESICTRYQHRIKPDDTLQLYTGLRQKKYCKIENEIFGFAEVTDKELCWIDGKQPCKSCEHRGAKLLRKATCTKSFPILYEKITEQYAILDGFEKGYQIGLCDEENWKCLYSSGEKTSQCYLCLPLDKMRDFLIRAYEAKNGKAIQIIRWKEKEEKALASQTILTKEGITA